jgi:hypothetical protein
MPAGMEAMAILTRNVTNRQKGMSKPTTTTGVVGEICDIYATFLFLNFSEQFSVKSPAAETRVGRPAILLCNPPRQLIMGSRSDTDKRPCYRAAAGRHIAPSRPRTISTPPSLTPSRHCSLSTRRVDGPARSRMWCYAMGRVVDFRSGHFQAQNPIICGRLQRTFTQTRRSGRLLSSFSDLSIISLLFLAQT